MKRFLGCLALAGALTFASGTIARAGVVGDESGGSPTDPTRTIITQTTTKKHYTDDVHRVVRGYAKVRLAPNFLDNDWDRGSLAGLTASERAYLKTVSGLDNGSWYYIDLTGQTVQTNSGFTSSGYVQTGDETDRVTSVIRIDGGTLTVHQDTRNLYHERDVYQLVADVFDNSPLVLDLNQDGKLDVAHNEWRPHAPEFYVETARFFDITGDGTPDFTEWKSLGTKDGILIRPENGKVENALQLFGTAGGYKHGFEKLSLVQDANQDGWIEGAELEGLFLWVDSNSDGTMQPAEMRTLDEYGIVRISTDHNNFVGRFITRDGGEQVMWDWWPATKETRRFRAH